MFSVLPNKIDHGISCGIKAYKLWYLVWAVFAREFGQQTAYL